MGDSDANETAASGMALNRPARLRTSDGRADSDARPAAPSTARPTDRHHPAAPPAGAHAAHHLINEDATPGAGVLPSHSPASGREVDGGAG